jgi:hypothetical protein
MLKYFIFIFFKSQIWLNCHLQEHIIPPPQQQLWYKQSDNIPNELKLLQKFDPVKKTILLTKKDNPKGDPEVLFCSLSVFFLCFLVQ